MSNFPKVENPRLNAVNPHFKSKYASLDEVLRVVSAGLGKNQRVQQSVGASDGLFHTALVEDGSVVASVSFPFPQTSKAQELGSALTYCRRYGLCLLFNLVGEEDDDGNAASGSKPKSKKSSKPAEKKAEPAKAVEASDDDDW